MADIAIRPANPERDALACADIYRPFVTDSWVSFELEPPSQEEMAARIRACSATHAWLVAECEGRTVGYAYGGPHRSRAAYAKSCDVAVYVATDSTRRGVGRALYGVLLPLLAEQFHAAFAGIALPNQASIALHKSLGFTSVGTYREVGWKMGAYRDVGWWQKML